MMIIARLVIEAEKEIIDKLKVIDQDIEDFVSPMNLVDNLERKHDIIEERTTGRLSTENLRKNYEKKGKILRELSELNQLKYYRKEWFE